MIRIALNFLICLMLASQVQAQEAPFARVSIEPETVEVGQAATLRISIFVPTWFSSPPDFPSFEIANAITRLPPDSSFPGSETINGATWTSVNRDYQVYPLLGANFRLQGGGMSVTYADPENSQTAEAVIDIPEIRFKGVVPEGAEQLDPYIAGTSFSLEQQVEGELAALKPGDAVVIRYTATLEGLPSLFIPSLFVQTDLPGASIYADEPVVSDDNGAASRSEKVTLVFDSGGEFVLPGISMEWWNSGSSTIETANTENLAFTVEGLPQDQQELSSGDETVLVDWRVVLVALLAVAAAVAAWFRYFPGIRRRIQQNRLRWLESEAYAWDRLKTVLQSGSSAEAYGEMVRWVNKLPGNPELRWFVDACGDESLSREFDILCRELYASMDSKADMAKLEKGLGRARKVYSIRGHESGIRILPALNP